jgi:glycosyltransferase involved in cell wall biosynthesis
MNILFLDQFSDIGGAQQCMLDLLPAIQENGWRVHAALPGDGPLCERLRAAGIPVTEIRCGPYRSGRKSLLDVARLAFDMRQQARVISRLLVEQRFDLIYVNGPRVMPAVAKAAGSSVPVLFHAHNHVGRQGSRKLLARSLTACDAKVVACCEFVAQPLRKYIAANQVRVIPNGVPDMRTGSQAKPAALGHLARIGVIGRIEPEKGQLEFLQAARILLKSGFGVQFVVCGSESPRVGRYAELVRRLGAKLQVEFTGWQDDVRQVLGRLDLLVIASRNEGFPRVMLEAFSAGVPVVAFPVGGMPEAIDDGVSGFLVPECSATALAASMGKALEGSWRREAIAGNARRAWETLYNPAIYRSRMTDVMASLLEQRGSLTAAAR